LGASKLSASQSQSKQAKKNVKATQDGLCVCMDCAYTTTVRFLNILCASLSLPQIPTRLHKVYNLFAQESTQSPRFKRKIKKRKAKYFLPFFSAPHHLPTQ
jgi:uncharacterized lipoprotein NlpE involved in copper resistance